VTIGNHIPEDDLVLFALQLLPDDRMRQAKIHAESCDLCRSEIAKLQGDLASYSMISDITAPPPEARERVLRQVAKEPKPVLPPEPVPVAVVDRPERVDRVERIDRADRGSEEPIFHTRQRRSLQVEAAEEEERDKRQSPRRAPWVLAWTGWAVAAGCSFVAGLQFHQRQQIQNTITAQQAKMDVVIKQSAHAQDALATLTAGNAMQVALHSTADLKPGVPAATAMAAYLEDKGALVFVATHMDPVPAGKTYELWLMPADGRNPMPAGMFRPDAQGNASVVMPQLPKGVPAKGFGVTVENEGGSDAPTLPIVLAGT